jgi:CheY-like chemotaxis protein
MDQTLQILLIDDDADDRDIFTWVIKGKDPTLRTAHALDGIEGLDMLMQDDSSFDIVFLDLNMPRMHGMEVLRRIRQMERHRETPVIVYSTSSNPHDIADARAAGASDYIVKGHELSVIRSELTQALKKYGSRSTHTYEK